MTNWHAWHEAYDDPGSSLSRRLRVVQDFLRPLVTALDRRHRILSLCAGDGRDIIPVLKTLPSGRRPQLVLVELDQELAEAGRQRAVDSGVETSVITGDAGASTTWDRYTPVDLLMLCGVFGNISDDDVRRTIAAARSIVVAHGAVIWTRGAFGDVDLRPTVRRWFAAEGFAELRYESEEGGYGVGVNQAPSQARAGPVPTRIFSFSR